MDIADLLSFAGEGFGAAARTTPSRNAVGPGGECLDLMGRSERIGEFGNVGAPEAERLPERSRSPAKQPGLCRAERCRLLGANPASPQKLGQFECVAPRDGSGERIYDAVPIEPTTASSGVPDASRFAPDSGRDLADPSDATAIAGMFPTQATLSASSPFRKLWARTPPVARPLPGNSDSADTLARPGSVPGRTSDDPEMVTTTAFPAGSTAPKKSAVDFAEMFIPAIPAAEILCGRTAEAGK